MHLYKIKVEGKINTVGGFSDAIVTTREFILTIYTDTVLTLKIVKLEFLWKIHFYSFFTINNFTYFIFFHKLFINKINDNYYNYKHIYSDFFRKFQNLLNDINKN